jgi:hypothetical protein
VVAFYVVLGMFMEALRGQLHDVKLGGVPFVVALLVMVAC